MDKGQENYISMCTAVDDTCAAESVIVAGVPALQTGHINLKKNIALVKAFQLIQDTKLSGWAAKKGNLKDDMITKSMKIVEGASAYAIASGDEVLQGELKYTKSELGEMRDEQVDVACNLINAKAGAIPIASLADYNIVAADFTNQTTAIGLYSAVRQMPSGKEDEKQVATKGIADTIELMRKNFKVMDKLVNTLKDSEPDFVKRYFNSREIYDLGVRHEQPPV